MSFMYVYEQGSRLRYENNRIVVEKGTYSRSLPVGNIDGIIAFGRVEITSPCLTHLMKQGIGMTFLSKTGSFFGRVESTAHVNIEKQRKQFRLGDSPSFRLGLAKKFVYGKLNNQAVFLSRINRHRKNPEARRSVEAIRLLRQRSEEADSIPELMGIEGAASRVYFKGLSELVPEAYRFEKRSRRPPKDRFNTLLSFGYTLLMYEIYSAVVAGGLHPYAAFLHSDKAGHPALASDLMEEWRPVLVDALAFSLVDRNAFAESDFREEGAAVLLNKEGVGRFIPAYEGKIREKVKYLNYLERHLSFRETIYHQVENLSRSVLEGNPDLYGPVLIR